MKNLRIEALILSLGFLLLGLFIEKGFRSFAERDRSVNVKVWQKWKSLPIK